MNVVSKGDTVPRRNIKIITDIFHADESSSQLEIKHGEEETFDSLFEREPSITPLISQSDIDSIQSQLNFKKQQRDEMINHLH